jgi:uncharacterized membrane protein
VEIEGEAAVFSGSSCSGIPDVNSSCNHLEEQVPERAYWGRSYSAARLPYRSNWGDPEPVIWHLAAGDQDTTLTFEASSDVTGLPLFHQLTLAAGEVVELTVSGTVDDPGDFLVEGTEPFGAVQFALSCGSVSEIEPLGDPCMALAVPIERYLDRYVVYAPPGWSHDYLVLSRAPGTAVTVDGQDVDAWSGWSQTSVVAAGWEVVRVEVGDGAHVVDGANPIGLLVAGYGYGDAYCYPGAFGAVHSDR